MWLREMVKNVAAGVHVDSPRTWATILYMAIAPNYILSVSFSFFKSPNQVYDCLVEVS